MSVEGANKLMDRFRKLPDEVKNKVKDVIEDVIYNIHRDAVLNAPAAGDTVKTQYGEQKINTGINQYIGQSISKGGLAGEVFIEKGATELAIYLEFGTGVSAAGYVPTLAKEFQDIARKYYINGKGTLIKHPFLIPAWVKHEPTVIPELKKALKGIKL